MTSEATLPRRKAFATAQAVFGLICLLVSATILYQAEAPQDDAKSTRIQGTIDFYSVGRGEAIVLKNSENKIVASCNVLDCGYRGDKKDRGQQAIFWLRGNEVIAIEIGGAIKSEASHTPTTTTRKRLLATAISLFGLVLLAFSIGAYWRK